MKPFKELKKLLKNPENFNHEFFNQAVREYKMPVWFIEKYLHLLDMSLILTFQKVNDEFLEKYKSRFGDYMWYYISYYQKPSENFLEKYKDYLYFTPICFNKKLSSKFIDKNIKYFDVSTLIIHQKLPIWLIEKHIDLFLVYSDELIRHKKLPEWFLNKYKDRFSKEDWKNISYYQDLSFEFVLKNKDKINFDFLFYNKNFISKLTESQKLYLEMLKKNETF